MANHPKSYVAIPTETPKGQPKSYLVAPVFHDGSSTEDLVSGEVLLSMTALTPFLPANDEILISECLGIETVEKVDNIAPRSWNLFTEKNGRYPFDGKKKLIEPLRMGQGDGRVVVPGARYKGLVGQSIGALFAAPFSRVAERTYSYRPNAVYPQNGKRIREPRPAIVVGETPNGLEIRVLPFTALSRIVFVREAAFPMINPAPGARQAKAVKGVRIDAPNGRRRLMSVAGSSEDLDGYCGHPYFGGVDGQGYMAKLFANQKGKGDVYNHVLVENSTLPSVEMTILKPILDQHAKTLLHLANRNTGHLRREHPLTHGGPDSEFQQNLPKIERGIASAAGAIRSPGQLIYIEVELDESGAITGVNSLGASYYYLWLCLDSVREIWSKEKNTLVPRPITIPRPEEWPQDRNLAHSPPRMLSMGRALLGYVSDERNPGTSGVGKGDFTEMAGRFAFNNALEVLQEGEVGNNDDRFLMSEHACVVPLLVLGTPRPSATEHHIQQSGLRRVGYGESLKELGGELSGYAFYAHQPPAALDPRVYSFPRNDDQNIKSAQSSLARFVSRPGRIFRMRLRFADLRRWELAALLACLRPGLLDAPESHPFRATEHQSAPRHAVKLGRGRPLGLGSLDISIDKVLTRDGQFIGEDDLRAQLLTVKKLLGDAGLQKTMQGWLEAHEYADKPTMGYPTKLKDGKDSIVAYYANTTREFLIGRRAW